MTYWPSRKWTLKERSASQIPVYIFWHSASVNFRPTWTLVNNNKKTKNNREKLFLN